MEYINKLVKYVKQVTMLASLKFFVLKLSITSLQSPYCACVPLCSSVKALEVGDSLDGVNRAVVFSLLYFPPK